MGRVGTDTVHKWDGCHYGVLILENGMGVIYLLFRLGSVSAVE